MDSPGDGLADSNLFRGREEFHPIEGVAMIGGISRMQSIPAIIVCIAVRVRLNGVCMMVVGVNIMSQLNQQETDEQVCYDLFTAHRGFKYTRLGPEFKGINCSFVDLI